MVGFMKGLGCGCCGDVCNNDYETGIFEDNFSARDAGWSRFNAASESSYAQLWTWTGGKLNFGPVFGLFHGTDFKAWHNRRKVKMLFSPNHTPRPVDVWTVESDVKLDRPRPGYSRFNPSGGPQPVGEGSGGGLTVTGSLEPTFPPASVFVSGKSIYLAWDSDYVTVAFGDEPPSPWEYISLVMVTTAGSTWTNHTTYNLEDRGTSEKILGIFNPRQQFPLGQRLYSEDSIDWNLKFSVSYEGGLELTRYYLNGVHVVTSTTIAPALGNLNPATVWCERSIALTGGRGYSRINREMREDAISKAVFDDYRHELFEGPP